MKQVLIKKIANTLFCSSLILGVGAYAEDPCPSGGTATDVSGKIVNNLQFPGGAFSTLGVVGLKVDRNIKMKCGLIGISTNLPLPDQPSEPPFDILVDVGFTHTISCDDDIEVDIGYGPETIHSQLTFDTVGELEGSFCNGVDETGGLFGPFVEYSSPQVLSGFSTGRGLFAGVTEGLLEIEGDINCFGSVDMKFEGYVCLH